MDGGPLGSVPWIRVAVDLHPNERDALPSRMTRVCGCRRQVENEEEEEGEGKGEAMYSVRGARVRCEAAEGGSDHTGAIQSLKQPFLLLLLTETGVPRRRWHLSDVEADAD